MNSSLYRLASDLSLFKFLILNEILKHFNIGIDAERAVNYHADSRGTQEAFGAIGNFACAFSAAPIMHFDNLFNDNQWRNSVDKDFFDRLKK